MAPQQGWEVAGNTEGTPATHPNPLFYKGGHGHPKGGSEPTQIWPKGSGNLVPPREWPLWGTCALCGLFLEKQVRL